MTHENPNESVSRDQKTRVENALAAAEAHCEEQGANLTAARRKVLEFLLQEQRALGAYAILDLLREAGFKSQPPVAYRALEFLTEQGFVHKIERLNAFVACEHPHENHLPAFMICRVCDIVEEAHSTKAALSTVAQETGFQIERTVIEAEGVCRNCAGTVSA